MLICYEAALINVILILIKGDVIHVHRFMSSADIFAISYHSLKPDSLMNNNATEKEMQQRFANFE